MSNWTTANIPRQDGKLAIITGANSGIGLHAARELARAGCTVIVACRSAEKSNSTRQRIVQEIPTALVEDAVLDLASLSSIRDFAQAFLATRRPLDLLINNAGVMALPSRMLTADGFELQIGTNHLGHFALTGLLLPALLAASAARIITVSSLAHRDGKIRLDDLQWERDYKPWPAYRQSKLANLLFGKELERRLEKSGSATQSIIVHPGISSTSLFRNGPGSGGGLKNAIIPMLIALHWAVRRARRIAHSLRCNRAGGARRPLLRSRWIPRNEGLPGRSEERSAGR